MQKFLRSYNRIIVAGVDILLFAICFAGAYVLRFSSFRVPLELYGLQIEIFLPLLLVVKAGVFWFMGCYREVWSKVSIVSLRKIIIANFISSVCFGIIILAVVYQQSVPRAILVIDFFLCLSATAGIRIAYRMAYESFYKNEVFRGDAKRVLIIGAGSMGDMLVREMVNARRPGRLVPVAFLDDNPQKKGKHLHGIPIVGPVSELVKTAKDYHADLVIIAMATLIGKHLREVLALCETARKELNVEYRIVPGNKAILEERVNLSQIRKVNAEDLVRRLPVQIQADEIKKRLLDKTILVTGAAGSIGSELARQVYEYLPLRMVCVDRGENALFHLQQEFNAGVPKNVRMEYIVGDACNADKMDKIFNRYRPDVVFHVAAYKHVPLMEYNPEEAIRNNVLSTQNMVTVADRHSVGNFVMVSTDKAIKPTSVMGASKRIAELVVREHQSRSKTVFTTVRFGNVIGSSGSLVPVLINQIRRGGPVTVTHPDIERFFMTIPEAVRLTTQAMVMGTGNDVFILDMGSPIKIKDFAEDLIRLSGFTPHEQIEIRFTGLRPGEKMFEELWTADEKIEETSHPGIRRAVFSHTVDHHFDAKIKDLLATATVFNREELVKKIKSIIPEATIAETL